GASIRRNGAEAAIVAVDVAAPGNISALKAISARLTSIPKRIFVIDGKGRLPIVQAFALGATHVLTSPVTQAELLAKLAPVEAALFPAGETRVTTMEAASAGAASIASMFSAVMKGSAIDVAGAMAAGSRIADSVAE